MGSQYGLYDVDYLNNSRAPTLRVGKERSTSPSHHQHPDQLQSLPLDFNTGGHSDTLQFQIPSFLTPVMMGAPTGPAFQHAYPPRWFDGTPSGALSSSTDASALYVVSYEICTAHRSMLTGMKTPSSAASSSPSSRFRMSRPQERHPRRQRLRVHSCMVFHRQRATMFSPSLPGTIPLLNCHPMSAPCPALKSPLPCRQTSWRTPRRFILPRALTCSTSSREWHRGRIRRYPLAL